MRSRSFMTESSFKQGSIWCTCTKGFCKRTKFASLGFSLVAALLLAPAARAERGLTLDDALQLAHAQSRDLGAARARLKQSETGIEQARVALLPQISTQLKYTHNYKEVTLDLAQQNAALFGFADVIKATSNNAAQNGAINQFEQAVTANTPGAIVIQKGEQIDYVLTATVPLIVPSAYPALTAARKTHAANEANFGVTEASLLYATGQAFFAAAGADELVTARRHAIEVARLTSDNARTRFQAGVVNRVEVERAELALLRAEQALLEAVDTQAQAHRALATMINLREPFVVVPQSSIDVLAAPALTLADRALELRPEVLAALRNVAAADATLSSAKWRWAPTVSAFGNFRAFNYAGFSGDNYAWAVGAQLDWLIYDGGARDAQRHLAQAQREENQLRLLQLRDTVHDEVLNARQAADTKRRALETAGRSVELSRSTLDLVRVQHEAGTATQLDLLAAQDNLIAAEVQVAQARFDLALADLSLRKAAGLFPSTK